MRHNLYNYNLNSNITEVSLKKLNKKDIININLTDIHSYISYCDYNFKDGIKTKSRKISSIKSFFKYLYNIVEILDSDPSEKLEMPKLQKILFI